VPGVLGLALSREDNWQALCQDVALDLATTVKGGLFQVDKNVMGREANMK